MVKGKMTRRLFTQDELRELATPYPDRIKSCIRENRLEEAVSLCKEMKESQVTLHDFFAETCTVWWSWVGENLGEERYEEMMRYLMEQDFHRQLLGLMPILSIYQRFAGLLMALAWRSHSCFGAGEYPGKFTITEDDEKFSFHMQPCASGQRCWIKGMYEPSRGGKLKEKACWYTRNRKNFPYYCTHCSFVNEAIPYERFGYCLWPTDEPQGPEDVCTWHFYKDPNQIPDKYYERLGLKKKQVPKIRPKRWMRRYLTEEELRELTRPIPDRIIEKIQKKDLEGALGLCAEVKSEPLGLHQIYVNILVSVLTFISDKAREATLGEVLDLQFEKCIKEQLFNRIKSMPPREKILFLATKIFGTDTCNQTGVPKGKFAITETDKAIVFTLDPCGSGGCLLRGGAYDTMSRWKRWRENLEDSLTIALCKLFPLSDSLLLWGFRVAGGNILGRKAYAQGKTKKEYPWSFGKKDVPYYCCQCGTLQNKLGDNFLKIHLPETKEHPCIWEIDKNYLEKGEA